MKQLRLTLLLHRMFFITNGNGTNTSYLERGKTI